MRKKRVFQIVAGASAAIVLVGVIWFATLDFELPTPTGAHAVGRSFGETEAERRLAYTTYYPAVAGTGHVGPYMPAPIADDIAERDLGVFSQVSDPWARVDHHARDGAAWSPGRFPLILFSPGADVQPQYYSSLLTELASHGFIVAALSHPGLTPYIAYSDGETAHSMDPPLPSSPEEAMRLHEERIALVASDIRVAIAHLRASPAIAPHWDGRVAAFGHSLGGAGAASAAALDPGIKAVGDIDGSLGVAARNHDFARPVFFMTDDGPVAQPDQAARAAFVQSGEPGLKVTLHGANHMTFATDVNFFEEAIPFADSDTLGANEAHQDISKPLIEFFTRAFLNEGSETA